jgi:hypothetical protein
MLIKTFESFLDGTEEREYTIDELPKHIRDSVVETERSYEHEHMPEDWYEDTVSSIEDELKELGWYGIEIEFTGFHSQGDGASFTAGLYDEDKNSFIESKLGLDVPKNVPAELSINVVRIDRQHSHENTIRGEVVVDGEEEVPMLNRKTGKPIEVELQTLWVDTEPYAEEIEEALTEWARTKSKEIYETLRKEYEGMFSDETIIDSLRMRGTKFDSKGNEIEE